jgi:hypothetical protein
MKNIRIISLLILALSIALPARSQDISPKEVDICVYGGTSAGVIAAYTAKMLNKSVLLIEQGQHLGGMSSGGLGFTDIGNKYVVQGLALDFYRRLGTHYGKLEQWIFEPGVAEAIFNHYIRQANVEVWFNKRLSHVEKQQNLLTAITLEDSQTPDSIYRKVYAKVFIDCSYEGDLMAHSGVSYTFGREPNIQYGETYNGVQMMNRHQFPDGVDPYRIKGDTSSGLLYGINPELPEANGSGDTKIQAYNFRITLTNRSENRIAITKPDNYDPSRYELLLRLKEIKPWDKHTDVFIWSLMPNGKTDINNFGGFSTDVIGENRNYPEASYEERAAIRKFHEDYTKGLLYFVGHDERIPERIRNQTLEWGYPRDEYTDNGHWTHQLYIREARRMIGETVMTQHHCQGRETVSDGIAYAAYTMDSHNCDRHVVNGMVKNEGNVEIAGFPPYPIAYSALTPKREEAANLLVPVCLSATHIAYGSIRMEPVFMVLGQVSAIAATLAIDNHRQCVQKVQAAEIESLFNLNPLSDGSLPEILIDNHSDNVVLTGDWEISPNSRKAYGRDYYTDTSRGTNFKSVRYIPEIFQAGDYDIYLFFPKIDGATSNTTILVSDGSQQKEVVVKSADVIVEGQTSGEWFRIGTFHLPAGKESYLEITNKGADGVVTADAVLLLPNKHT